MGQNSSSGVPCTGGRSRDHPSNTPRTTDTTDNGAAGAKDSEKERPRNLCGTCGSMREKDGTETGSRTCEIGVLQKESPVVANSGPATDPVLLASIPEHSDGSTGGTSLDCQRRRTRSCNLALDGGAVDAYFPVQLLFGEKALTPKIRAMRALEAEAGVLKQTRTRIAERLDHVSRQGVSTSALKSAVASRSRAPAVAGANSRTPAPDSSTTPVLESEASTGGGVTEKGAEMPAEDGATKETIPKESEPGLWIAEWVEWFFQVEDATKGVSAGWVSDVLTDVFGIAHREISPHEIETGYMEILEGLASAAVARSESINIEIERLDQDVKQTEELICMCFDELDQSETPEGMLSSEHFVKYVVAEDIQDEGVGAKVKMQDALQLFNQMAKGASSITFDTFKGEVTQGCLQVLHKNIELRRTEQKRYRDTWF